MSLLAHVSAHTIQGMLRTVVNGEDASLRSA
jgi:hypothetical protein